MGGDVLTGSNAIWEFEADRLLIRYDRGIRTPKLLHVLGERRIPYQALAGVELAPGRRGTVVLRARPRPGADPLVEAAAGQLKDAADPYRLVLSAAREAAAERYADELRTAIGGTDPTPSRRFLVAAPRSPRKFKAYDAKASFDGRTVVFRLFWSGATSAKWKAGDQRFAVSELAGVEWRSPEVWHGCLRLRLREDALPHEPPDDPAQDPASVVFGLGYGVVHESLPFAASVLEAIGATSAAAAPVPTEGSAGATGSSAGAARARAARRPGARRREEPLPEDEFTAGRPGLPADL